VTYALALSEDERRRYRLMAETARTEEAPYLIAAGLRPGAVVADVGCGPSATLRLLAQEVGPLGRAIGVDQAADAVAAASEEVGDLRQASVRSGDATDTGLPLGSFDVVVCRHVLAHNGGREAEIVGHLAQLARPGGAVYLADVDAAAIWMQPYDPSLAELDERYRAYHNILGNDLTVGRALGSFLESAGLTVQRFRCGGPAIRVPPGMRGPAWAARNALRDAGLATEADLARWEAAFARLDARLDRPWVSLPTCVAVGQRPAHDPLPEDLR
jgi:SAM-dependent methyltransferase